MYILIYPYKDISLYKNYKINYNKTIRTMFL